MKVRTPHAALGVTVEVDTSGLAGTQGSDGESTDERNSWIVEESYRSKSLVLVKEQLRSRSWI